MEGATNSGEGLPAQVLAAYGLDVCGGKKKKNYRLLEKGRESILVAEYSAKKGYPAQAIKWQNYLCGKGCGQVLPLLKTKNGGDLCECEGRLFLAARWPEGPAYFETGFFQPENNVQLQAAARGLAKLHGYDDGHRPEDDRGLYFFRPSLFQDRLTDLLACRRSIKKNKAGTDFERIFLENFDSLYDQGQAALQNMILAGYGADGGFPCALLINSFTEEDLFIHEEEVIYLNLSESAAGPRLLDLALLIAGYLPRHCWDAELLFALIEEYARHRLLRAEDKYFLLALLRFPSRLWLYAYQYCQAAEDAAALAERLKGYLAERYWRDLGLSVLETRLREV